MDDLEMSCQMSDAYTGHPSRGIAKMDQEAWLRVVHLVRKWETEAVRRAVQRALAHSQAIVLEVRDEWT